MPLIPRTFSSAMRTWLCALALGGAGVVVAQDRALPAGPAAPPLPTSASAWVGAPQSWSALRGKVVLLDVWAFGCVNCVNTIPWVKSVHERYADRGVAVIGVHTPEFGFERKRDAFLAEIKKYGIRYPQLLDNEMAYWKALGTHYWPTTYLVDKCGRLRDTHIGEVHEGQFSGDEIEGKLETLIAESGDCRS
jgi:thiol-disulfide isomerase/thioredoxin